MHRQASETMTPPAASRGVSRRQRAKLRPARAGPGERCWRSAAPRGAALTAPEDQGRTWADDGR